MSGVAEPGALAVVLVNWNGFEDTADCLESLRRAKGTRPAFSCIVVDNGSTDGSPQRVAAEFPWVRLVELGSNLGYAAGCNEGIRVALADGADLVLLLNNDTIVEPGFLEGMLSAAHDPENRLYGMLTAIIVERGQPERIWSAGGTVRLWRCYMGNRRPLPEGNKTVAPCDFATGCCSLVRRQVIEQIGLVDDSLFAYVEDVDWSLRAREAGWQIGVVCGARVRHRVSASMARNALGDEGGTTSGAQYYYNIRNRYIVLRRHGSPLDIACGWTWHTVRSLILAGGHLILGRLAKARMALRGIADGMRLRGGSAPGLDR